MRHTPAKEGCPRYSEWVWGPGWTPGNPEKPPHAPRPAAPPGTHSPLTLARAAEPGSVDPCCCRMPSGPSATGRPGAGREQPRATRQAGRRRRASSPADAETRPEPEESLAERGVAPRGRRGRVPPCPSPPCPTFPTGERPPLARHGSVLGGSSADALLPGTGPQECGRPPGGDGAHSRTASTHSPYRAVPRSPVLITVLLSLSSLSSHCGERFVWSGFREVQPTCEASSPPGWPLALKLQLQSYLREQAAPRGHRCSQTFGLGPFLGTFLLKQETKDILSSCKRNLGLLGSILLDTLFFKAEI